MDAKKVKELEKELDDVEKEESDFSSLTEEVIAIQDEGDKVKSSKTD